MRCKPNKDLTSTAVSVSSYYLTIIEQKFALLKGPGNKSKYRLSLLTNFAYGGLPRGKNLLRIWTESCVKTRNILDF